MVIAICFLALFATIALCLGLILIKWVVTQVSLTIFLALLFLLLAIFMLAFIEPEEEEEDSEE